MPSPLRPSGLCRLPSIVTMTSYAHRLTGNHRCKLACSTPLKTVNQRCQRRTHRIQAQMATRNCRNFPQGFHCLSVELSVVRSCTRSFLWQRQRSTNWSNAANSHGGSISPPAALYGTSKRSKLGWKCASGHRVLTNQPGRVDLMSESASVDPCATQPLGRNRGQAINSLSSRPAVIGSRRTSLARLTSNAARAVSSIFRSRA
jgi:hypothetical protein